MLRDMEINQAVRTLLDTTYNFGGASVSLTGAKWLTQGYLVGGVVKPLVIKVEEMIPSSRAWLHAEIYKFVREHEEHLTKDGYVLGSWTDDDMDVYFDVSQVLYVKEYAMMMGRDRDELAIWDIENGKEITL